MAEDRQFITPDSHKWMKRGPASTAVRAGDLLFVTGQAGLDGKGRPTAPGDVKAQASRAFEQIRDILREAGGSLADVVDVMSFHKDPRSMDPVFDVARKFFKADYPAWTALGMVGAPHPETEVVVRVIAHLGKGKKHCINPRSTGWMKELPMSAACRKGDYMFTSGLIASDNRGDVVAPSDHMAQARFCYDRLKDVMAAAGATFDDIVDMICFNQDARGMDPAVDTWCNETVEGLPIKQATSYTAIAMTGLYRLGHVGAYRAIADFSGGPRVAVNLPSVHWHDQRIAGASKQKSGRLIGISGQVASDGQQNIIARGDTASQARYCFSQIRGVLEKQGAGMDDIVEIISFHKDPRAWDIVMGVGEEIFDSRRGPAWTPIGCTGLYLEGYLHEIYAVAMV
jgi:enamine deaminase RidA (YjgF/YER057c/UK114 family)